MARATGAGALDPPRSRSSHVVHVERVEPVRVRHHEIDRLRILAVLLLFPLHAARVFNENSDWYAKNGRKARSFRGSSSTSSTRGTCPCCSSWPASPRGTRSHIAPRARTRASAPAACWCPCCSGSWSWCRPSRSWPASGSGARVVVPGLPERLLHRRHRSVRLRRRLHTGPPVVHLVPAPVRPPHAPRAGGDPPRRAPPRDRPALDARRHALRVPACRGVARSRGRLEPIRHDGDVRGRIRTGLEQAPPGADPPPMGDRPAGRHRHDDVPLRDLDHRGRRRLDRRNVAGGGLPAVRELEHVAVGARPDRRRERVPRAAPDPAAVTRTRPPTPGTCSIRR